MADYRMPALGADMESGKLVQWLVQPGAPVRSGDVVAVVETHKGAIDCEIFLDGVIEDLVPVGTELRVGEVMAHVRQPGEAPAAAPEPVAVPPRAVEAVAAVSPTPASASAVRAPADRARISPAARERARTLGIDPASLQGTGIDGSVVLADVEQAAARLAPGAAAPAATPPPVAARHGGFDPAAMRQAIAAAMSRSKREIPHYYLGETIDLAAALDWLAAYNAGRSPQDRLLPAALLLKAAARALAQVPQLNGFHENGAFRPGDGVHVGWAVALRGGGLVAPAIHHADRKTPAALMADLRDLVQRARAGGLRSSELADPTITVTSLGERGAESVIGVIYPPQVATLGFGRIVERPCAAGGQVVVHPTVAASLAADHRASDGHLGGQLLTAIARALQDPASL